MALTTDRMAEIADYCKVEAAAGTLRAEQYLQCIKYLTLDLYDRRDRTLEGSVTDNPAFRGLFNQLKMTEDVPNSGTSSGEG